MDTPANTWVYFISGYAVILLAILGYIISLAVRWTRLKNELKSKDYINKKSKTI